MKSHMTRFLKPGLTPSRTMMFLMTFFLTLMGTIASYSQDPAQYGTPFAGVPNRMDANIYQMNLREYSSTRNIAGARAKLQRIKDLGINVLYLMPVYPVGVLKSPDGSPYAIKDLKGVASDLGTLTDLRGLVADAHTLGMAVILDFVVNQTSWDHPWITEHPDWYKKDASGAIKSPCPAPDFCFSDVAEIDLNVAGARAAMIDAMRYWIFAANVDGFRMDWADKAPQSFWQSAISNLRGITTHNLLLLAEGSNEGTNSGCTTCGENQPGYHYASGFDYIFGTNFYWNVMKKIWVSGEPAKNLDGVTTGEYTGASSTQLVARFLSDHDDYNADGSPFSFLTGGRNAVMSAFVVATYHRSVPFIYNGIEVGNTNPLPYPWKTGNINWTQDLTVYTEMQKLLNFRNSSVALRRGQPTSYIDPANTNPDVIAFTKTSGTEKVVVLVNVRNSAKSFTIPSGMAGTYKDMNNVTVTLTTGASQSLSAFQYLVLTNASVPVVAVTGVTVSPSTVSVKAGLTTQLSASIAPSNATNQSVAWTSSNNAVATVNSTGLVTAVAQGTATITATTADGGKTSTCTVTVTPPTTFTVYFSKPAAWGTNIRMYNWAAQPAGVLADGTWPGVAMTLGADGWYSYTFTNVTSTNLIFNAGNDTDKTADLTRGTTGWYLGTTWYDTKPGVPNSLTVSPTSLSVGSAASASTITVTSNVSWTVTVNQTWITTSATSGSNNGSFTVSTAANTGAARTGTVTVTGGGITQTISVSQSAAPAAAAIPGTIQAESWTAMSGVQTETTTDTNGGLNVGWIDAGDWMDYSVNVATAGSYTVSFRMASGGSGGTLQLRNSAGTTLCSGTIAGTGGWQTWTTVNATATLAAGTQTLRLYASTGGYNVNWVQFASVANSLTVSPTSLSPGSAAATSTITVTSNVSWTVSDNQTWITTSSTSGSNNGSFTVSVTANTGAARTGAVTVTGGGITQTINVSQSAAGAVTYYTIQNRWKGTYLYDAGASVGYGATVANNNYKWEKVAVDATYFWLRNVGTGEYMHIENQTGSVQCTAITSTWWSSQWSQDNVDATYIRIRNRWQTGSIVHVEGQTGSAQYAGAQDGWYSAQWQLATIGARVSTDIEEASIEGEESVTVFPVPVKGNVLNVIVHELKDNDTAPMILHTINGTIALEKNVHHTEIIQHNLPAGLYVMRVQLGKKAVLKKVLIED
jgi:glycosidase